MLLCWSWDGRMRICCSSKLSGEGNKQSNELCGKSGFVDLGRRGVMAFGIPRCIRAWYEGMVFSSVSTSLVPG